DARDGSAVWSRNASTDTGAQRPDWGFASSPVVVNDLVIVASSGRLAAYDVATGEPRWVRRTLGGGYSSPQFVTLDGVAQILMQTGGGVSSVAPADGAVLWEYKWQIGAAIVQPALVDASILVAGSDGMGGGGLRRLAVTRGSGGWTATER